MTFATTVGPCPHCGRDDDAAAAERAQPSIIDDRCLERGCACASARAEEVTTVRLAVPASNDWVTRAGVIRPSLTDEEVVGATAGEVVLKPAASLLVKLGSIAVHADELLSADGHAFDRVALQALLHDPEVVQWVQHMTEAALVPVKRNGAKR